MRVTFHDHGGKGARLAAALHAAGHETVPGGGDVALIDHDYYAEICDAHEVVVVYPHGGNVMLDWDGFALHPHVRLCLTHALGHAEIMEGYGLGVPIVPVGWCFSDLAESRYTEQVRSVLFAPMHPLANGYLNPVFAEANRQALAKLLAAEINVDVRIFGSPVGYGLDPSTPVRWVPGGNLTHRDIDAADLVVAEGTTLALAVARGVPVLTFGADIEPDMGRDGVVRPAHWADYAATMRYPYDLDDGPLDHLVASVTQHDSSVAYWRARFVGGAFDPDVAVRAIVAAAERAEAA